MTTGGCSPEGGAGRQLQWRRAQGYEKEKIDMRSMAVMMMMTTTTS